MHGIEPQAVEAILAQPIQRIVDGESAYFAHPVIDRATPRGLRLGEEGWRVAAEIISLWSEVIVDNIEEHHQPAQVCFVDQRLEIIGAAVSTVGCVPQHAVISPVSRS